MKLETTQPTDSKFIKFEKVGDSCKGLFQSYGMNNSGSFGPKAELIIKTKEGLKSISCPTHLKQICDENVEKMRGKVLTITLIALVPTGKGNPMKKFEVDAAEPKGKAPPPPEDDEVSDADEDMPF